MRSPIFAVINQSTLFSDADAAKAAHAINTQMNQHIAPAWGRYPPHVGFYGKNPPAGSQQLVILDHADQADALGYHDETPAGEPYARIFVEPVLSSGGTALAGADPSNPTVSSVLSHEAAEQFVDPTCTAWMDASFTYQGRHYSAVALEVGDPVEGDGYWIGVNGHNVAVSNFVYPAWFDAEAPKGALLDHLNLVQTPFEMTAGGYLIVRAKEGAVSQIFGSTRGTWRTGGKQHPVSRTFRRISAL